MSTARGTWKAFERKVANLLGGTRTPLSGGNSKHTRGDVIHKKWYVECKLSGKTGLMLKQWDKEWIEARKHALEEDKTPMFVFQPKGSKEPMVVMRFKDFVEAIE